MWQVPVFCASQKPVCLNFYIHTSHIPKDQTRMPFRRSPLGPSRHDALSRQPNTDATIRLLVISYGSLDLDATNEEQSATSNVLCTSADARKQE